MLSSLFQLSRLDSEGQVIRTFLNSVLALSLPQYNMAAQKHPCKLTVVSNVGLSEGQTIR